MDTQQFINTILPAEGVHCITMMFATRAVSKEVVKYGEIAGWGASSARSIDKGAKAYASFTSLGSLTEGFYADPVTGKRRLNTAHNTAWLKTLFLDLDVGPNDYETDIDAMAALFLFCEDLYLPDPLIVATGGGIHAFLPFRVAVDKARWGVLAEKLAMVCKHYGLKVDTARTQDCASQPRIPESINLKYNPPRVVEIVNEGEVGSDVAIEGTLDAYIREHGITLEKSKAPTESSGDRTGGAESVVSGCAQVANQNGAPHHAWRGMISIMAYCDGGRAVAERLSAQDARHTAEGFTQKWDEFLSSGHKPSTCSYFNKHRPGVCQSCPNFEKITSPIRLGYVGKHVTTTGPRDDFPDPTTNPEAYPELRRAPAGEHVTVPPVHVTPVRRVTQVDKPPVFYSHVYTIKSDPAEKEFGVFKKRKTTDDPSDDDEDEGPKHTKIFNYVPTIKNHIVESHDGVSSFFIGMEFATKCGLVTEIEIPLRSLTKAELLKTLFDGGVLATGTQQKHLTDFITEFIMQLKDQPYFTPVQSAECLGLSKDRTQFLLGHRAYRVGGDFVRYKPRKGLYAVGTATEPQGTLEGWKRIADLYNGRDMAWAQCVIAATIAAPLLCTWGSALGDKAEDGASTIPFASVVVSLFGGSGDGKTGVQKVANSIWGHPTDMMGLKADTPLAKFQQIGTYNNIPVQFDEMSGMNADEISAFAYQCTQGRPKNASTAEGTKRKNELRWNTVITMSTNTSQIDILRDRGAAEAQIRRIFELKTTPLSLVSKYGAAEADELLGNLRNHYGIVGHEIARLFMQDATRHADALSKIYNDLYTKYGLATKDRFYVTYIALVIYGCKLGRELGVLNYSSIALEHYLVLRAQQLSKCADQTVVHEAESSLFDAFLSEHIAAQITVQSHKRGNDANGNKLPRAIYGSTETDKGYLIGDLPMQKLFIRKCIEERMMYVSKAALKEWCKQKERTNGNSYRYSALIDQLQHDGRLLPTPTECIMMGSGTSLGDSAGNARCIAVKLDGYDVEGMM